MTSDWPRQLSGLLASGPCVLVSVLSVKGSAPRAVGSRMLVTRQSFEGSIGGGNLEYQALARARALLDAAEPTAYSERFGLGPELNQCCGGAVTLRFEAMSRPPAWLTGIDDIDARSVLWTPRAGDQPSGLVESPTGGPPGSVIENAEGLYETLGTGSIDLRLYGAGHVGKAVVNSLANQPVRVTWYDARAEAFPEAQPPNVTVNAGDDGLAAAGSAPPEALHLVMTHSHELDEDLCHAVLAGPGFAWLGLIGSVTKRARFAHRLRQRGITDACLERLVCPVGLPGLAGKRPATIAVAITAQLLAEQVPAHLK